MSDKNDNVWAFLTFISIAAMIIAAVFFFMQLTYSRKLSCVESGHLVTECIELFK